MSEHAQQNLEDKIEKTVAKLKEELNTVRAGRANPAILDRIEIEYYGTATPLKQVANISVPEPRTLLVTPFDPQVINEIEHAIVAANIGINPANDGKVLRLAIPQLTEERRKELTKTVKAIGEDAKVSIRNIRKHANDQIKKEEKSGDLTEDDAKADLDHIQKSVDEAVKTIDKIIEEKDKEILEV